MGNTRIITLAIFTVVAGTTFAGDRAAPRRFDGNRIVREISMEYEYPPEEIFPLLCPVREYDWMASWKGTTVYSDSGYAEKYVVFFHGMPFPFVFKKVYWTATEYVPVERIQWCITVPGVCLIVIDEVLEPLEGNRTRIDYLYTVTGVSVRGNKIMAKMFSEENLAREQERTKEELEHYLANGRMLETEFRSKMFD